MATIWDVYYNGLSFEEIKEINPFACPSWLRDGANLSEHRMRHIINLFNGKDNVPASRIRGLIRNEGEYAAFRAIVHGFAYHDGEGGLIRIDSDKVGMSTKQNTNVPGEKETNSKARDKKAPQRPSARTNESINLQEKDIDGIRQVIEKKGQY